MKQLRRILLILLSATVISAVGSGGSAIVKARSQYYGVCSQLAGFPGVLQAAGLLQRGNCRHDHGQGGWGESLKDDDHRDDHDEDCDVGRECKVEGRRGSCRKEQMWGHRRICVCVAEVSK